MTSLEGRSDTPDAGGVNHVYPMALSFPLLPAGHRDHAAEVQRYCRAGGWGQKAFRRELSLALLLGSRATSSSTAAGRVGYFRQRGLFFDQRPKKRYRRASCSASATLVESQKSESAGCD
jgi:hypothetical protein